MSRPTVPPDHPRAQGPAQHPELRAERKGGSGPWPLSQGSRCGGGARCRAAPLSWPVATLGSLLLFLLQAHWEFMSLETIASGFVVNSRSVTGLCFPPSSDSSQKPGHFVSSTDPTAASAQALVRHTHHPCPARGGSGAGPFRACRLDVCAHALGSPRPVLLPQGTGHSRRARPPGGGSTVIRPPPPARW